MKTVVALIDFSDVTVKVLEQAKYAAQIYGARIVLLHVVPKEPVVLDLGLISPTVLTEPSARLIAADRERLLGYRDELTGAGVEVVVEQLLEGSVDRILQDCLRWDAELILLGSHHHSALYKLFIGSFTEDISKRAHCPVLVVPADPDRE
jgi:nucleotide-binding universal stress UspA family protein